MTGCLFSFLAFNTSSALYDSYIRLIALLTAKISKSVTENKTCHPVNHRSVETFFLLLAVFLLERFIYCVHHGNRTDTRFCFREGYSKLTFCSIISPGIISNTMVYADCPLCKIYILTPQADCFTNPAPCS